MPKATNLQEISENIKRAQNIIRTVDEVINDLNQAVGNIFQVRGPVALWKGLLLFGASEKRAASKKAKCIITDMRYLMDDFINSLKIIANNFPEYTYNDYAIDEDFTHIYAYLPKTDINKIKGYKVDNDVKNLTSVSAKAAKIKNDLSDLKNNLNKIA